jgi:hypothetical protein
MREHSLDLLLFECVQCPRQHGRVVGDVEDYMMGIVCDGRCPNNMESGAIVDYQCHKFEDIDQYKHAVIGIASESECTLDHFIQKKNVPPESQCNQESSSAFQGTISNCLSKMRSRD